MGNLERRLRRLEQPDSAGYTVNVEKLRSLSDEDLETLEDEVEEAVRRGERPFWDLYAVVTVKSQRASAALFEELETRRKSGEPYLFGGELPEPRKNAYRIWKYHGNDRMPERLREELHGREGAAM